MDEEYPCPYCGEQIKNVAVICRFCKSKLSAKINQDHGSPHELEIEPNRPISIVLFELLFYASIAISTTQMIIFPVDFSDESTIYKQALFENAYVAMYIFITAVFTFLAYLTARHGNNAARWIITIVTVLSALTSLLISIDPEYIYEYYNDTEETLTILTWVIDFLSIYLLFTPKSNTWFRAFSKK